MGGPAEELCESHSFPVSMLITLDWSLQAPVFTEMGNIAFPLAGGVKQEDVRAILNVTGSLKRKSQLWSIYQLLILLISLYI